ncbi:hypothetical protein C8Q76DRAFT_139960 [Earliella scabrosa]|nr:hypothetical protein C8Q76DRAFT_139960 [Earliella scabrosa]
MTDVHCAISLSLSLALVITFLCTDVDVRYGGAGSCLHTRPSNTTRPPPTPPGAGCMEARLSHSERGRTPSLSVCVSSDRGSGCGLVLQDRHTLARKWLCAAPCHSLGRVCRGTGLRPSPPWYVSCGTGSGFWCLSCVRGSSVDAMSVSLSFAFARLTIAVRYLRSEGLQGVSIEIFYVDISCSTPFVASPPLACSIGIEDMVR